MARYKRLEGTPKEGAIVVRLLKEGDGAKAMITRIDDPDDPAAPTVFPSEEMSPEEAFRVVENKREAMGDAEVLVEMEVGVAWNPAWGTLH